MKLLGIVVFFLAVLCVCTVGENGTSTSTVNSTISALTTKPVAEVNGVNATTSQTTRLQMPVPTVTAARASNETITSSPTSSPPNATSRITQATTTRTPAVTSTANKCSSTTNTTEASATQLAQHESLNASSTMRWSSPSTVSPERNTSASGTSGLSVNSPTNLTNPASGSHGSGSANKDDLGSNIPYSNVILPIVVTLVIITLSVFSLVALYKMCQKKTPERQENGAEQAQSDKEGVKLLSVKTTSPETVFVEVCDIYEVGFSLPSANLSEPTTPPPSGEVSQGRTTGEHSSQGKNKTRQLFTSQQ